MLKINEGILEKVNKWNDNYYVLVDFDRTITSGSSESSWGVLTNFKSVPKEYSEERKKLFNYYRPIELDLSLDFETKNKYMIEWWTKHISLLIKYGFKEEDIKNDTDSVSILKIRTGVDKFLKIMHEKNIPVIIISAGLGNFIEKFLIQNDSMYDNIYIVANYIKFENGVASGITNDIIHSLNKNDIAIPKDIKELIKTRENIVLFGDTIEDIKMVSDEKRSSALKIGFLNDSTESEMEAYLANYDIVGYNAATFNEVINLLDIFK